MPTATWPNACWPRSTPAEIAAMLVHAHRAQMPEPEDLIANTPEARRDAQKERHRPGFEDTVWFRMDIGRRQNADPRWILPLLCRRGHITRNEIGAIRIGPDETFFQIPRTISEKFADAAARTAQSESDDEPVTITQSETGPREEARSNRKRGPNRDNAGGPRVSAKPAGKKFDKARKRKDGPKPAYGKPAHGKPAHGKPAGAKPGKPFKAGKPKPQHKRKPD